MTTAAKPTDSTWPSVTNVRMLNDGMLRTRATSEVFRDEWLRLHLDAATWQRVQHLPVSLLKDLYRAVWFLGPHYIAFNDYYRGFMRLVNALAGTARTAFEHDFVDTYRASNMTGTAEYTRHLLFDARDSHAFSRVLLLGAPVNGGESRTLYAVMRKLWEYEVPVLKSAAGLDALGVMAMILLMQHLTPRENIDGWREMRKNHVLFCQRWSLPTGIDEVSVTAG